MQPGELSLNDARKINDMMTFIDGIKNSAGTGDMDFSVGPGGITTDVELPRNAMITVLDNDVRWDGRWNSQVILFDEAQLKVTLNVPVWLREVNDNDLVAGQNYIGYATGYNTDYNASGVAGNVASGIVGTIGSGLGRTVYTCDVNDTQQIVLIRSGNATTSGTYYSFYNSSGSYSGSVTSGVYQVSGYPVYSGWYYGTIQEYDNGNFAGFTTCYFVELNGNPVQVNTQWLATQVGATTVFNSGAYTSGTGFVSGAVISGVPQSQFSVYTPILAGNVPQLPTQTVQIVSDWICNPVTNQPSFCYTYINVPFSWLVAPPNGYGGGVIQSGYGQQINSGLASGTPGTGYGNYCQSTDYLANVIWSGTGNYSGGAP